MDSGWVEINWMKKFSRFANILHGKRRFYTRIQTEIHAHVHFTAGIHNSA